MRRATHILLLAAIWLCTTTVMPRPLVRALPVHPRLPVPHAEPLTPATPTSAPDLPQGQRAYFPLGVFEDANVMH